MPRIYAAGAIAAVLVLAACSQPAAQLSAPAATPAGKPTSPPAAAAAAPSPSASAVPTERVEGVVQQAGASQIGLGGGRTFTLASNTRVTRAQKITPADLQPGQYVAVTAKRQADNTLLASVVNVFPPSLGQVAPGQRPLPEGNLMTNASIDQVQGNTFTVTFPGGGARVQLAPDAQLTKQTDATPSDIKAGDNVVVQSVNGDARAVTIQPSR